MSLLYQEACPRWLDRITKSPVLLERWNQVKEGQGHVILLTGDAGIGEVPTGADAEGPCCQRASYALGMLELGRYLRTRHCFLWLICSNGYGGLKPMELPDAKLEKLAHALSQYRLPMEESVTLCAFALGVHT